MSMLEELWIGGLDYQGRPVKKGSAMERKMCLYARKAEKMKGMLTGPQVEQYEKTIDPSACQHAQSAGQTAQRFIQPVDLPRSQEPGAAHLHQRSLPKAEGAAEEGGAAIHPLP